MVLHLATCCSQQLFLLENVLVNVVALHVEVQLYLKYNFALTWCYEARRALFSVLWVAKKVPNWAVRNESGTYSCPDRDGTGLGTLYEKSGQSRRIRDG